jgi:tetratricopeptide (TPR) repeat protein
MAKKQTKRVHPKDGSTVCAVDSVDQTVARIREAYALDAFDTCYNMFSQLVGATGSDINTLPVETVKMASWAAYRVNKCNAAFDWMSTVATSAINDDDRLLQTLVNYEYRDFAGAVTIGEPLLDPNRLEQVCADHRDTIALQVNFLNRVGVSQHNLGNNQEAIALLIRAIEVNKDNPESYINLATVLGHLGDTAGRRRAISDGLVYCSHKDDLRKLALEFLGEETISLCMIVRNEEEMLVQCLESVSGLVDEIIIVDTGSEDRTVEIAKRYGARVYHHPWENNFSLARNQSLEYATCDWIFILDADEVLTREDHAKLRQATRIPDYSIVSLSVHNCRLDSNIETSFLPSVRLWRRKLNCHYEGIVHNELRLPVGEPVLRGDIRIVHYGYGLAEDKMRRKLARSMALLKKQLEDNPNSAFSHFNYSQLIRGEYGTLPPDVCNEILFHSGRAVELSDPTLQSQRHIQLMALDQMVSAYYFLEEYDQAEACVRRALSIDPNYIDALFSLGPLYAARRDFPKAIAAYERFLQAVDDYDPGAEVTNYILQHAADQATAYFRLGLIYEELRQNDQAIACFKKVLDYKPDYADVLTHLAMLHYRANDFESARNYAEKRLANSANDLTARSILAEIARSQGRLGVARAHCVSILESDSENQNALNLLVRIEREAGDLERALTWIDRLLVTGTNDYNALGTKAEILMGLMRYRESMQVYETMQERFPDDAEVANNLGNCHFKLQDYSNAIRCYSVALALESQMAIALRNLGYTYFKVGDHANAVRKLTNYLDHVPEDFDILYLVARLYFGLGQHADALRYVERCIMLQPHSAELPAFLADCYLKLGHVESARQGYQKALTLDPGFEPARTMLEELRGLAATSAALTRLAKQGAKT